MSVLELPQLEPIEHRDKGQRFETFVVEHAPDLVRNDFFQAGNTIYQTVHVGRVMDCQSEYEKSGMYRVRCRKV